MAKIKVHAGDFLAGDGRFQSGALTLRTTRHNILGETILTSQLNSVDVASEESVKKIGGTLGWGVLGAAALGPAGLLAGLILGGKNKDVTFIAKFKDGRKLLATTDSKSFTKLQAAVF